MQLLTACDVWLVADVCSAAWLQGLVFAVATESGVIKLYDVRSYDKGPFDSFQVGFFPALLI